MKFFKKESYKEIKFYLRQILILNENDILFTRYLGKIYNSSTNVDIITNKDFSKIKKKLNFVIKFKNLSYEMKITLKLMILKMEYERIPKLKNEFKIGNFISDETIKNYLKNNNINCEDNEKIYKFVKKFSADPFYKKKNIFIGKGEN